METLLAHKAPLEVPYDMNALLDTPLLIMPKYTRSVLPTNNGAIQNQLVKVCTAITYQVNKCANKNRKIKRKWCTVDIQSEV